MNAWYIEYVSNLTKKELNKNIHFKYVGTGYGRMSVNEIILHIVNHGTYHRGFITEMMFQIPTNTPTTDLTVFLRNIYEKA